MNISDKQQTGLNYQTQNNNSVSKTVSTNEFLNTVQEIESNKNQSINDNVNKEEFDEKYKLGLQRYNALGIAGGEKWFEHSIFEKDKNAKDKFINYLSEMDIRDFMSLSSKLWSSFGSGLMEDENGNIVPGNHEKNPLKEFKTFESTKKYFEDEIIAIEEGAKRFGGDPSKIIELLTDVLNFFKSFQSKEQKSWTDDIDINKILKNKDEIKTSVEENNFILENYIQNTKEQKQEDLEIFKKILEDRKVSESELNNLSYKQIEQFADYFIKNPTILKTDSTTDIDNNKFFSMMFSTKTTANSEFNRAIYETNKTINNESERTNFNNELIANLAQYKYGKELMPTFYNEAFRANPWEIEDININFNEFLSNVINMHNVAITNISSKVVVEQHQKILDSYMLLDKNYKI